MKPVSFFINWENYNEKETLAAAVAVPVSLSVDLIRIFFLFRLDLARLLEKLRAARKCAAKRGLTIA